MNPTVKSTRYGRVATFRLPTCPDLGPPFVSTSDHRPALPQTFTAAHQLKQTSGRRKQQDTVVDGLPPPYEVRLRITHSDKDKTFDITIQFGDETPVSLSTLLSARIWARFLYWTWCVELLKHEGKLVDVEPIMDKTFTKAEVRSAGGAVETKLTPLSRRAGQEKEEGGRVAVAGFHHQERGAQRQWLSCERKIRRERRGPS